MPSSIKTIPANMWVWELQEKLETAHNMVRNYSGTAIHRYKTYHDHKMSWEKFKPGDQVYVYFPQKKVGCTPKFTSFWRGPYNVLTKHSEVLYGVDCGRKGSELVIHCDRLRRKRGQMLRGESEELEINTQDVPVVQDIPVDDKTDETEEVENLVPTSGRPKREIRAPARYKDYIMP